MEAVEKVTEGKGKKRGELGEARRSGESKKTIEIVFWNIAELKRKDRDFWDYLERFDVIHLCETWREGREWESLKLRLSKISYENVNMQLR